MARVAVSPEEIGLCGAWQVIAVERFSREVNEPESSASREIGCYITSVAEDERTGAELMAAIRGHWSAIENGTHYRRDVTLGEDACRAADRKGAAVLASLRNLANGLYELEKERERTAVDSLKSWCQQQTFTTAWLILKR